MDDPPLALVISLSAGAILGLCAPGINQWYLAWFSLAPLLLLAVSSATAVQALWRGLSFGLGYTLVYLNWYLGLYPLNWLGFNEWQSAAMVATAWLLVSLYQALNTAVFAFLCRALPLTGSFLPRKVDDRWCLPALIVAPALWVALQNKILNAPDFLGVPWPMLEYSQWQQLPIIQIASSIGGIGIAFAIVLFNTVLATCFATFTGKLKLKSLAASSNGAATRCLLTVALLFMTSYAWGLSVLAGPPPKADIPLAVVQGNINIEMQKTVHRYTLRELLDHYGRMLTAGRGGITILSESAVPTYLSGEPEVVTWLSKLAVKRHSDIVVGALDADKQGRPYNSAYGFTAGGAQVTPVYHKRYLVPFGEYAPSIVNYMPKVVRKLTNTPAGGGFAAGKDPSVLPLRYGHVAPLICFETISPELVAASVRRGGELIVNLTDLAWFHNSIAGDQMLAFSVLRAVENRRFFVFAANTGPSAIIDSFGRILKRTPLSKQTLLEGRVGFSPDLTPFTFWYR